MSELKLASVIGFGGGVRDGLVVHPNGEQLIYPLGTTLVVESIAGKRAQTFLHGHTDNVTCVAVSQSGQYVASGQQTTSGRLPDSEGYQVCLPRLLPVYVLLCIVFDFRDFWSV